MNTHSHSRPNLHGRVRRLLLLYALYATLPLAAITAAPWQVNDEVKLPRDTPLLFGEKPFRTGKAGETFRVLAYKADLKKVFLAAKDGKGKAIALNVAEDLVVLPAPDVARVQADTQTAVKNQQFSVANQIVERALRAKPDDPNLQSLRSTLQALSKSAEELTQARARQQVARDEIKRLRRNADVADHPNLLDARDRSGQQRASTIRSQATQLEEQSEATVTEFQRSFDATLAALETGNVSAQGNSTDHHRSDLEVSQRQQTLAESAREWTNDAETIPEETKFATPSYQETVNFVNSRLNGRLKIWYGRRHDKLIIEFGPGPNWSETGICALKPAALNSEVKYFKTADGYHYVQVESSAREQAIEFPLFGDDERRFNRTVRFYCSDEIDAEKISRAFSHLITMFGGTKDPF